MHYVQPWGRFFCSMQACADMYTCQYEHRGQQSVHVVSVRGTLINHCSLPVNIQWSFPDVIQPSKWHDTYTCSYCLQWQNCGTRTCLAHMTLIPTGNSERKNRNGRTDGRWEAERHWKRRLLADVVLTWILSIHLIYTWSTLGIHFVYIWSTPCQHAATMPTDCYAQTKKALVANNTLNQHQTTKGRVPSRATMCKFVWHRMVSLLLFYREPSATHFDKHKATIVLVMNAQESP